MGETMFENFDIWVDDTLCDNHPFVVACKDQENTSEEKWVLVSLSVEEARKVYEYLDQHLKNFKD